MKKIGLLLAMLGLSGMLVIGVSQGPSDRCCRDACAGLDSTTSPTFNQCHLACMREKTGGGPCRK